MNLHYAPLMHSRQRYSSGVVALHHLEQLLSRTLKHLLYNSCKSEFYEGLEVGGGIAYMIQ